MIAFLTGRVGMIAAGVLAVGLMAGAIYWVGASGSKLKAELAQCRAAVATWERIQDADVSRGDPADDLDWLLRRSGQ